MKAVVVHVYGPPESLRYDDFPDPAPPGPNEVLIRIAAASVNPADARLASGEHAELWPLSSLPRASGRDLAGVVEAVGPGVTDYRVGDKVYGYSGLHWAGTWADKIVMPTEWLAPAPKSISLIEAAALPVVALTAWVTLFIDWHIERGQRLLVNGAAGGVGSMAVQMAKAAGVYVIGSASTSKQDYLRELGCDEVIDYSKTPVDSVVDQVDAVLDGTGTQSDSRKRSYALVKPGGWLASVSNEYDPDAAERHGIRIAPTFGRVEGDALHRIAREVDEGRLKVNISKTFPMSEAAKALAGVAEGHSLGKVVLVNS